MQKNVFVINTLNTHYVMGVNNNGVLQHIHWGAKLPTEEYSVFNHWERNSNHSALDYTKEEYSVFGGTRYRAAALKCIYADGCRDSVFTFKSVNQQEGLLEVTLTDSKYNVDLVLSYAYSSDHDIITRTATVINNGTATITLERVFSAELNLPSKAPYKVINTNGSWGAEFLLESNELKNGTIVYESKKGTAGHTHSPFVIMHRDATEDCGDVYFAALGYGGNFKIEVNRDFCDTTRCMLGISDFDFSYSLGAGEKFTTPRVYMGYTTGFTAMSNMMNDFAVDNILPKGYAKKPLPVLYNSWEATEFDVNTHDQLALARIAADIGCELFVMDDGWFGKRNNDRAGLGDWYVNADKFPNGLGELIDGVNKLGMDFGLWFEPEMIQQDSDLYRAHPEWTYHYDARTPSELRHQLVLNLTRDDVREYVFDCMDSMLSKYNIRYIKWDMNRPFSEIGADNLDNGKELWYRHTMAVYDIADRLHKKYPYLQLEACSSGGGRAELGAMEHFDMVWTSDNTDPVDRLYIQRGYSMLYPRKCMRAWVTDAGGSCRCSDDFRFNTSMQGSLSIGSHLLKKDEKTLQDYKDYIARYKSIRDTIQFGDLYRLASYDDDGVFITQYVSKDKSQSVLFISTAPTSLFNKQDKEFKLKGLDPNVDYVCRYNDSTYRHSGQFLMNKWHRVTIGGALQSRVVVLNRA
ncbi:MAG: alpha-galactosidase [Eubacterium sp.]